MNLIFTNILVILIGGLLGMITMPIFGYLSDNFKGNCINRVGKRTPFVIIGSLGCCAGIIIMSAFSILRLFYVFAISWAITSIFLSMAVAPYSAVIPDTVQREQFGAASGWLGLLSMIGYGVGGSLGFFYLALGGFTYSVYFVAGLFLLCSGITCISIRMKTYNFNEDSQQNRNMFKDIWGGIKAPFKSSDFCWVFFTRTCMGMGFYTLQQFIQYYIHDVIPTPYKVFSLIDIKDDVTSATSLFLLVLLLGAVSSSIIGGILSDKYGRKIFIYISGLVQFLAIIPFLLPYLNEYQYILIWGFIFGLGYGMYQSVDWALASDVLPSAKNFAKDIAIWQLSTNIPQIISPFLAGLLLDEFSKIAPPESPNLGYDVIFGIAMFWFAIGTIFVKNVKMEKLRRGQALDDLFTLSGESSFDDYLGVEFDRIEEISVGELEIGFSSDS
eukprot:TRINITY_DN4104_c3_g1_i1.p1 TRINITY_DN4104_c3_g1~~TRINITY_DN4104_c3_g1_i1.p1  ORF type:complete len:442 (-),score=67.85 TRINITY_DN4104_c3_g1_i1:35-1360(-)